MSLFSIIKRNAKNALGNSWGPAMLVMLIPALAVSALSMFIGFITVSLLSASSSFGDLVIPNPYDTNSIMLFLSRNSSALITIGIVALLYLAIVIFVISPLSMGTQYWHLQLVKGKPQPVSGIFHFFENFRSYRRAVWMNVNLGVRRALWAVAYFIIPAALMFGNTMLSVRFGSPLDAATPSHYRLLLFMGYFLIFIVYIVVAILYVAHVNKYALAPYLLCENDQVTTGQAIKESINYTKGYRFSILWFTLSFIGWYILSMILFPVTLYSVPYFSASMALFSLYIIETKRREQPVVVDKLDIMRESATAEIVPSPTGVESTNDMEFDEVEESVVDSVWGADSMLDTNDTE